MTPEEIKAIRAEHEVCAALGYDSVDRAVAHRQRGVLLAEVDRLTAERDDLRDQLRRRVGWKFGPAAEGSTE